MAECSKCGMDRHIRIFIIKVAESCNLNCPYCGFFLSQPKTGRYIMDVECLEQLIKRVGEYCREHSIEDLQFGWHGGEPMLAGHDFFRHVRYYQKKYLPKNILVCNNIQTNLTLLNEPWVDLLASLGFNIKFSLNGPPQINDRSRYYPNGKGSYSDVVKGIELLKKKGIDFGCLCVIDPSANGREVYEHLVSLGLKHFDFLPILATHDLSTMETPSDRDFGDFLIEAFDAWFDQDDPSIDVRWFIDVIRKYLGGQAITCSLNKQCSNHLTIGFNGEIYTCDCLKICGKRLYSTGKTIYDTSFSEIEQSPLFVYLHSEKQISPVCKTCDVFDLCGGGCPTWRYSKSVDWFLDEGVYCKALIKIFTHIKNRLRYYV
jgi:uncharacterized protein